MRHFVWIVFASSMVSSVAFAEEPKAPPPSPEVKRTVDAFTGKWAYDVNVTMPGKPVVKGKLQFDCKKTALGKGVACSAGGSVPGLGKMEASFMMAYDAWSKAVHVMSVTSDDEVHDHKCTWKDDKKLDCEPLKAGMGGQEITEDLSFTIEGKTLVLKSVTTMKDGSKMVFEGIGKKK